MTIQRKEMNTDYEICGIEFGLLSDDEIERISVCQLTSSKLEGVGSVYDPKLGVSANFETCVSCFQGVNMCPGHFGRIFLHYPILHPCFPKYILMYLKCFCFYCSRLLVTKKHFEFLEIQEFRNGQEDGYIRMQQLIPLLESYKCFHCSMIQPKIFFKTTSELFFFLQKDEKEKKEYTDDMIMALFSNIQEEDLTILEINHEMMHPKHFIMRNILVIPPSARPCLVSDFNFCDDDITIQYTEIIKNNNLLADISSMTVEKFTKIYQTIKFRYKTLISNSKNKAKHPNGRVVKSLKPRLGGKGGLCRLNLMGKRVDLSARTVASPDPTLRFDQVGVPEEFAKTLTIDFDVNEYNIDYMEDLMRQGKINVVMRKKIVDGVETEDRDKIKMLFAQKRMSEMLIPNDIIIRDGKKIMISELNLDFVLKEGDHLQRNGKIKTNPKIAKNIMYPLKQGDIVKRQLLDGDPLLLNRQPTLHEGSMMSHKAKIHKAKTFSTSLSVTKSYNCDFDGDELNIHVPQSQMAISELNELSAPTKHVISSQSSSPNITIVQDSLLGAYLMTKDIQPITKSRLHQIIMKVIDIEKTILNIKRVNAVLADKPFNVYCGKGLFSLLLPNDFFYHFNGVVIEKGVLMEGTITKSALSSGHHSIIQFLFKEYPEQVCFDFIDNIQFITNAWLLDRGFSIGIGDCMPINENMDQIVSDTIASFYKEAKYYEEKLSNAIVKENKVNQVLSKARDKSMALIKTNLDPSNNFFATVESGSKGNYFNIAQICGLLGQQYMSGKRINSPLHEKIRSLPHFHPPECKVDDEYEECGFIKSCFLKGLNPREFIIHSMTGREGITDTAVKTADSGYIQRRLIKRAEDKKIMYDGTVRDINGSVIEFKYGDCGLDGTYTMIKNGEQVVCDIERMVNRLHCNLEHEK